MGFPFGPLIGAGATLLGGFLGQKTQNEQQERNIALQREFAQTGIQWKVADAKKAGVHPLYALGAPTISPAVSVQGSPLAQGIAAAGQDLGRAVAATRSTEDRASAVSSAVQALQLENMSLQNDFLRSRIARLSQGQIGPAMPTGASTEDQEFKVGADSKVGLRPPLMMGGTRLMTNPNTSNMEDFEKRFGDDGPAQWLLQAGVGYNDLITNMGQPSSWPMQMVQEAWRRMSQELKDEYGNFDRFVRSLGGRFGRGDPGLERRRGY